MNDMEKMKVMLRDEVQRHTPAPGSYSTAIQGVAVHRRDTVTTPENCFYIPRVIKIVQGKKRSVVGGKEFFYDEDNVFIAGVDMPNTSCIYEASPEKPFLSITLDIDRTILTQLVTEMPDSTANYDDGNGFLLQPVDTEMLDAFLRLLALFDKQEQTPVLAPLIIKEIHYRALIGPGGDKLRMLYSYGSQRSQVARAISWLRVNFRERCTIDELAGKVHMATSTFHRRFKEITTVSPLQFQKRLRLHEAQRLMLVEDCDVTSACEAVGYESLTQFNREYKRLFGEPPRRDVIRWQREKISIPALVPGE